MTAKAFHIKSFPKLNNPILIAGFDGLGNALNVSIALIDYLNRKLKGQPIAQVNSDVFYRFDQARPWVEIENGYLKSMTLPGGSITVAKTNGDECDVVMLKADEPHLNWIFFAEHLIEFCQLIGVKKIITIGSMYNHVLHSDNFISAITSHPQILQSLKKHEIYPVFYSGPCSIQLVIQAKGKAMGLECHSLWAQCPHYLQDMTHFGLMLRLGKVLSKEFNFTLDFKELNDHWNTMGNKIEALIQKNPELQSIIDDLRKAKLRGSWMGQQAAAPKDGKIINLKDFLYPKD